MHNDLKKLPLDELRKQWSLAWGQEPHTRIGRTMLEKSLLLKTQSKVTAKQQVQLNQRVKQYKRNPVCFDERCGALKPGTRLMRKWKGKQHSVLVRAEGFEYQDRPYTSLSQIANVITGTRWNGYVFFGLKK